MIILILMLFTGVLGSIPDMTITGQIEEQLYKIECYATDKPLEIEFLTDDRTECAISTPTGNCTYFSFEHVEPGGVVLVSYREPYNDQIFGCEMIFNHADDFFKIHCSVKYNGTDFVQIPKYITPIADFSYNGNVHISTTAQDFGIYLIVCLAVVVPVVLLFVIEAVKFYRKSNRESTCTSRTRRRGSDSTGKDATELQLCVPII